MTLSEILLQQLANGLILGSFYALVALGYTMVYGIIKLLNFAHGDVYMVGAFVGFLSFGFISPTLGSGWLGIAPALLFAMVTAGLLGMLIERVAYRPMLAAPRLSILITALAVSMVLENGVLAATSGQIEAFSTDLDFAGVDIAAVHVTTTQMILVGSAVLLMAAMQVFVSRTLWGKAMRAIAIDIDACLLMGIDVNRVIALTFFVGSALAGAAGVMAGVYYGSLYYFMGFLIGLKAFTAAVIGGIGSIPGAMLGGLVLGLLEAFGTQIQVVGTEWKDVFVFAILILLLVFRPTGLLGRTEVERM